MKIIKYFVIVTAFSITISSCLIKKHEQVKEEIISQQEAQSAKIESIKDSVLNANTSAPVYKQLGWNETLHDFEDVPSGPPAKTIFKFINNSSIPVKITNLQPGCSCTTTDFSRNEIQPNDTGFIEASYKTSNTFGYFKKYISVYFNNEKERQVLTITGNVDPMKH